MLLVVLNAACSSKPPESPQPEGEFTPVNPDEINLSDLRN
jgi:hypothetical protein